MTDGTGTDNTGTKTDGTGTGTYVTGSTETGTDNLALYLMVLVLTVLELVLRILALVLTVLALVLAVLSNGTDSTKSERKLILTSSPGSLACALVHLAAFWSLLAQLQSVKSIYPQPSRFG